MSLSNGGSNSNYLEVTSGITPIAGIDFTMAIWTAQQTGGSSVHSYEQSGVTQLVFYDDGTRQETYFDFATNQAFPGGLYTVGQWCFYAITHVSASNSTVMYRGANGAALSTTTISETGPSVFTAPTSWTIFNEASHDSAVNGNVIDLKFWTGAALSGREVANQYLSIFPRARVEALERWIPMLDVGNPGEAYMGRGRSFPKVGTITAAHSMPSIPYRIPMLI